MKRIMVILLFVFLLNSMLNAQSNLKIAVLDFQTNGTPQFIGNAVADITATVFKTDNDIIILERSQIKQILKERDLLKNDKTDLKDAIEFGQILSVNKLIIGSVSKIGNSYTITGKIVEIKSGAIEYAESENCAEIDDIEVATRYLATKLLNKLSKKYYELPDKKYLSKSYSDQIDVSFCARYGIIWGFKIPRIELSGEKIKIIAEEKNLSVLEGIVSSDFYLNKNLSIKGLFKYTNSLTTDRKRYFEYYNDVSYDERLENFIPSTSYAGVSLGLGAQYNFIFHKFIPFISSNLILTKYWFTDNFYEQYEVDGCTGNLIEDYQSYKISFTQNSNVLSAELTAGFKLFFSENFGLNFALGADVPFYGSQFNKLNIQKTSSDTDDNRISPLHQDLENKLKFNEKNFIQPPMYFVQLGFVYHI